MPDLNKALGRAIIDGGIARVAADTQLYGDAEKVVLATARAQEMFLDIANKSGANAFQRMLANKLSDLAVASLHGADISAVLERAIADVARMAPLADLQGRVAQKKDLDGMADKAGEGRGPQTLVFSQSRRAEFDVVVGAGEVLQSPDDLPVLLGNADPAPEGPFVRIVAGEVTDAPADVRILADGVEFIGTVRQSSPVDRAA